MSPTDVLLAMRHSPVRNYAVPGLTSWLIGEPGPNGAVRLFESDRDQQENITPHSHRFDFKCLVLSGRVRNRTWLKGACGDPYLRSEQRLGRMGGYELTPGAVDYYDYLDSIYREGDWYSMKSHEIHSIWFARNTRVLFFEGPEVIETTSILEPMCHGVLVPTFKVEPWMFQRGIE